MFGGIIGSSCFICTLISSATVLVVVGLGITIALTNNSFINELVNLPIVINTWTFTNATSKAWEAISLKKLSALDAVEIGCSTCEEEQCDGTVGFGGSPDENGETTLDAFIMDGATLNVGAVGALRKIKRAISVARRVLENTQHSFLAGELATQFALSMGFTEESLTSNRSKQIWLNWKAKNCQPNFWTDVKPDPSKNCGPYSPLQIKKISKQNKYNNEINEYNHDTIGMLVVDTQNNIAAGTSTNGANHKIPGRVGDSPMVGAGAYADNTVGGAACTGDGDIMLRFVPRPAYVKHDPTQLPGHGSSCSYIPLVISFLHCAIVNRHISVIQIIRFCFLAVEEMRRGANPTDAAKTAIQRIAKFYPKFSGAIIVTNIKGEYGAACHGLQQFPFSVCNPKFGSVTVLKVNCEDH